MDLERYKNIWLENGNQNVTLTYNKAEDKWYDNFGESGDWGKYGITSSYYSKTDYNILNGYEAKNLYHFFEDDGKLPDGFKLNISVTCPKYRYTTSGGYVYNQNSVHSDNDKITDFKMEELDPAHPELGGVDYSVAKDGATYTFDGRTQPDGSIGVWRDEG